MFKFKLFLSSICISLLCVGFLCSPAFSTTLIVNGSGELTGAEDVVVNGTTYNVSFIDENPYTYQGSGDVITFSSLTDAMAGSQALLDYVFIDDYDTDPTLTFGIENYRVGRILTFYNYDENSEWFYWAEATNWFNTVTDTTTDLGYGNRVLLENIDTGEARVWALWTAANTSPAPEPTTILMLGTGLLSLAGLSRKRHFNEA